MVCMQAARDSSIYGLRVREMMFWLAQAATELREQKGRKQVHIAASASIDQSTVNRFERGESRPANLDRMVAAYADDLDMDALAIWEHAIKLWRNESTPSGEAPQPIEDFVSEHIPAAPPAPRAVRSAPSTRKARTAGRSPGQDAHEDSRAS